MLYSIVHVSQQDRQKNEKYWNFENHGEWRQSFGIIDHNFLLHVR